MAFGFLGRRRRGPRRDRGGLVAPPGARLPHERDQVVQQPPRPRDKLRRAARDQESSQDTEARWRAMEEFSRGNRSSADKSAPVKPAPVIVRRRHRI
jgi:hypothetical protein